MQPESKRMSLGEEHGILAVEDLRWLPRQRKRGVRCSPTCWNLDTAEKKGQVLTPCTQDEVVEVAFACHIMRRSRSRKLPRQSWQLWHDKDEEKYE